MPDLAIIVPTRGRPENIEKVIAAWRFTDAWADADLILAADADDPQIDRYRALVDLWSLAPALPITLVVCPEWVPMVHKLDRVAVNLAEQRTYFALGFAGDDHLPQTIGWTKSYLTALRELGSGMVYGDDGYQGRKLSTEWAVTADVVREIGRMVPAPVEHMYCDNAIMDLFREAGALKHLPEVRIEHMHPVAGKAETDAQYQRVNHRDQFTKDRTAYTRWKLDRMAADVAAVRALRPGRPDVRPEVPRTNIRNPGSGARQIVTSRGRQVSGPRRGATVPRNSPFPYQFKAVRGATSDEIALTLADFAKQVSTEHEIVELGVFQARTALIMAWGASQGNGAHVTAIDPWDLPGNVYDPPFTDSETKAYARQNVDSLGYGGRVELVNGFSHEVATMWPEPWFSGGKQVGLLFVDGDHTKEGAKRDILSWAPHLVPCARIAVDDYGHPDWPGVGEAVDELVAEGLVEPVKIYHDQLAVTQLTAKGVEYFREVAGPTPAAITSEGVSPSPYPAADGQVAVPIVTPAVGAVPVRPTEDVELPETAPPLRTVAAEGELEGVAEGTTISDLTIAQLKALAKAREIKLGARKDKRAEILQALMDGK